LNSYIHCFPTGRVENVLLGTSGWSYREWVGPFYKLAGEKKLSFYSSVFKTAEINSTFYAYPSRGTVLGWNRYTGRDFIFTAKLPKVITHEKKLNLNEDVEDDLKRFCDLMNPLRSARKLGCILIQLPPSLRFEAEAIGDFLSRLPSGFKFALEPRHRSWMDDAAWRLLQDHCVAYTTVDEPLLPPVVKVTSDIAYFRWHGRGERPWYNYRYTPEELKPWLPKIAQASREAKTVYGYFNNHFHGYAVENCLQVLDMLGILTPEQMEAKQRVQDFLAGKIPPGEVGHTVPLTSFMELKEAEPLEKLLATFTNRARIERGRAIGRDQVRVSSADEGSVEAVVRGYPITIDATDRRIRHNCADWTKGIPHRRFCKHVVSLMFSLPPGLASALLKKMIQERGEWEFLAL